MEALFEALAFLIQAITIGGITAAVLAVVGIVPIQVHRYIDITVSSEAKATELLKSWEIFIGDDGELRSEEDSRDEL
jgi:hypothetical protein